MYEDTHDRCGRTSARIVVFDNSWAGVRPDEASARAKAAFVGAKTVATRLGSDKVAKRPAACVSNTTH